MRKIKKNDEYETMLITFILGIFIFIIKFNNQSLGEQIFLIQNNIPGFVG